MSVVIKGNSNVNLDFSTGGRITGDFSNATLANRVMFQSTTAGGGTSVAAIPNATGDNSAFNVFANPDPTNTSFGQFRVGAGTGDVRLTSGISGTGTYLPMTFYTGGSERARIDTAGNLGLGVTPSAWGSDTRALQIFNRTSLSDLQSTTQLTNNGIWNGTNWVYRETAAAGNYNINGNSHVWRIAPSGTAGNTISFTQAMTLDASGNLLVNTTSASSSASRLQVSGTGSLASTTVTRSNMAGAYFRDTAGNNNTGVGIWFDHGSLLAGIASSRANTGNWGTDLRFYTHSDTTSGIDESYERARITSGGDLLVGTTSSAGRITVLADSGNNVAAFRSAGAVSATRFARFDVNTSTEVGSIQYNGTGTSYVTTSDYRLKENIAPMTGALAKVALLKPCSYTWKSNGERDEGFIAHELAEVCPRAVSGEKDAVNEDGSIKPQGIDTSFLVATLTAAIQEQQAIIESLTARITALEAK